MDFTETTELVIDTLEGGYYHPDMLNDGRVRDSRYGRSGETMFGIDRLRGGKLNTSPDGIAFWRLIDNTNARSRWKWNYKGGSLAPQLKKHVVGMMKPHYQSLSNRYMSYRTKDIVNKDNKLRFHFIYASWNGAGWFRKFASDINEAVEMGITNPERLQEIAIKSRTDEGLSKGSSPSSLIAQGGRKMSRLFEEYADKFSSYGAKGILMSFMYNPIKFIKRNWWVILLLMAFLGGIGVITQRLVKMRK